MKIILASTSSFRKKALELVGLDFETVPSHLDETSIRDDDPQKLAHKLAEAKALAVAKDNKGIIVGSDLIVHHNRKIYEKPRNRNHAMSMLKSFSGNDVDVVAGIAVYNTTNEKMLSTASSFTVRFRNLIDKEIRRYVERYPVTNLAGAFEGDALLLFADTIKGSYPFLLGLPIKDLIVFLREHGVDV